MQAQALLESGLARAKAIASGPRDRAIDLVERWMAAEFLEQRIAYFWGDGRNDIYWFNPQSPDGADKLLVYNAVLRMIRMLLDRLQTVSASLRRLAAIDGVDATMTGELRTQANRMVRAFRQMTAQPNASKRPGHFDNLDRLFAWYENGIAWRLLLRAWSKCVYDKRFAAVAVLAELISDLLVEQQKSLIRMRELRELYSINQDDTAIAMHYEAIYRKFSNGQN
jgi:hypothetical protein